MSRKKQHPNDFDDMFDDFNPSKKYQTTEPLSKATLAKMTLLDKLEQLVALANGCGFSDEFFAMHADHIQSVADDLQLTPSQTVLLCPFINDPDNHISSRDLQSYFECGAIALMRHNDDLNTLLRRRYLISSGGFHRNDGSKVLTDKAKKALCNNHGLPPIKTTGLNPHEFMSLIRMIYMEFNKYHNIEGDEFQDEVKQVICDNPHLKIVQAFNNLNVHLEDKLVLLRYCIAAIDRVDGIPLNELDEFVCDIYTFSQIIINGSHPFTRDGLLAPCENQGMFSRDMYCLSEKGQKIFLSEYPFLNKTDEDDNFNHATIIRYDEIKSKNLYYCDEDRGQIDTLKGLLDDKQLKSIRKRLESANMRKGFNCLFYGRPGTGKTETALQLARLTKRDIMQVDISAMRDKWYGETEKIVKNIFSNYANLVKKSKLIPILLINEADALLSVRTSVGGNNPTIEKTENAIQNILLESMENLDGILIATTNLTCNLDSAFERRFLYKVEFHQPSVEAKTNIWKSLMPEISHETAQTLAHNYDFSGGQIENIARKVMVNQLLFGESLDLHHIEKICTQETIGSKNIRKTMGFVKR